MKYIISTLGCKVNQYETQAMETLLQQQGHSRAVPGELADAVIINTCAVTAESGRKSRQTIRRLKEENPGAVVAVGNAPTALVRLTELMQQGARPALVVAVPVGFVNVVESKQQIFAACQALGVPCIAAMGRKGGSSVAAAIGNALLYTAADTLDPARRGWK